MAGAIWQEYALLTVFAGGVTLAIVAQVCWARHKRRKRVRGFPVESKRN